MPYQVDTVDPTRTAVIVVDMQHDFIAEGAPMETPAGRAMVPTVVELVNGARGAGATIVFTAHRHRHDGSDMGRFGDLYQAIRERRGLIEGESGSGLYPAFEPEAGDILISKRRYSAFFATDLDLILRERHLDTVVIAGVSSENCCLSTARHAMFLGYKVVFLADATATHDYPDLGWGGLPSKELHNAVLTIVAFSTGHVMNTADLFARFTSTPAAPRESQ
jgi:ureidoacrylate peracid hydrolase